jgi:hypothetical protein
VLLAPPAAPGPYPAPGPSPAPAPALLLLLLLLLILLVLLLLVVAFVVKRVLTPPPPPVVVTAPVTVADIEDSVLATGTIGYQQVRGPRQCMQLVVNRPARYGLRDVKHRKQSNC